MKKIFIIAILANVLILAGCSNTTNKDQETNLNLISGLQQQIIWFQQQMSGLQQTINKLEIENTELKNKKTTIGSQKSTTSSQKEKDNCPGGDQTMSLYDGKCQEGNSYE